MYNAGKILIGLIIFLALILSPLLFNVGKTAIPPKLEVGTKEKECVESVAYMKSSHMQLLNTWRDEVVRNGKREYISSTGKKFDMSLQNTCTKCHTKKEQFCDRCHNYVDASPKCWDCHVAPEQKAAPQEKQARRSDN